MATSKMFVSVGLSVRNEEKYIAHCLRALLKQDLLRELPPQQKEIIVCDNSSTDKTREIVRTFQKHHPEIKLISSGARSKAAGINRIMQVVNPKAQVVCFFDGDVVPKRNAVRLLLNFLMTHKKYDIVSGKVLSAPMAHQARLKVASKFRYPMNIFARLYLKGKTKRPKTTGISGAIFAIRKDSFKPIPQNIIRDDFFLSLVAKNVAMLEDVVVYHRAKTKQALLASDKRARIGRLQLEELFGKKYVRSLDRARYKKLFETRNLTTIEKIHFPFFIIYFRAMRALQDIKAKISYPKLKQKIDGSFNSKIFGTRKRPR